jgi:hypothetical protein
LLTVESVPADGFVTNIGHQQREFSLQAKGHDLSAAFKKFSAFITQGEEKNKIWLQRSTCRVRGYIILFYNEVGA